MANRYLEHYGVLGMKWGRRKSAARTARRDASDLRKHGYKKEAAALEKNARELEKNIPAVIKKRRAVRAAGQSAVLSGLVTFGANKLMGHSSARAGKAALQSAAFAGVLSATIQSYLDS